MAGRRGGGAQIEEMLTTLPALRQRDDFVSIIPVPTIKEYGRDLPQAQVAPLNPDWGAWDYRSVGCSGPFTAGLDYMCQGLEPAGARIVRCNTTVVVGV